MNEALRDEPMCYDDQRESMLTVLCKTASVPVLIVSGNKSLEKQVIFDPI